KENTVAIDIKDREDEVVENVKGREDTVVENVEVIITGDDKYSGFSKAETLELEILDDIDPINVPESKFCLSFKHTLPTIYSVFMRMPRSLLPFSFGMFILVEGWISLFADFFSTLTPSFIPAVFVTAFASIVLCNLLNNLPMTVLFARILQHPNFSQAPHVTPSVMTGCLFALVIGSNVGACFTIVGALAGLM
ncbi:16677_t:CDS:2, partial [Acaulospora colombiana]